MKGGTKVMPPIFFSENVTAITIKCTWAIHTSFEITRLFFCAYHKWHMETLNKLRQRIGRFRANRNMKDVLLLHDNAQPHTGSRTRGAILKMERTVLPHPAHSPDLAPSNYRLFGPVRDALRGRHFVDDNELKQSFRDELQSGGRAFYSTGIQRLTQHWQKFVENGGDCGKIASQLQNM
jgi:hypothetical protein